MEAREARENLTMRLYQSTGIDPGTWVKMQIGAAHDRGEIDAVMRLVEMRYEDIADIDEYEWDYPD